MGIPSFEPYYDTLAGSREFTYIYEDINTGCADTLEEKPLFTNYQIQLILV